MCCWNMIKRLKIAGFYLCQLGVIEICKLNCYIRKYNKLQIIPQDIFTKYKVVFKGLKLILKFV